MKRQSTLVLAISLVCFIVHSARADLTPLPNTGEAGDGIIETNYVLTYAANLTDTPVAMTAFGFETTHPAWVTAPVGSLWIAPTYTDAAAGYYFYELNFSIPELLSISGKWATDNYGEIFLNDLSTGITKGEYGYTSLEPFNITSGFTGDNTLVFRVWNHKESNTGLLVTDLNAELVPEPSSVILGSIGLTFTGWLLHRRKTI